MISRLIFCLASIFICTRGLAEGLCAVPLSTEPAIQAVPWVSEDKRCVTDAQARPGSAPQLV